MWISSFFIILVNDPSYLSSPELSRGLQAAVLCCQIVERKLSFSLDLFLTKNSLGENCLLILPLLGARNLLAIPRVETAVIATAGLCWAYHLWFFSGGKEGEWLPFSMGCTGWFLSLQCVCLTCCLKCLFLELECESHPFVLSISFYFFSIVDPLVQCIKTIMYFMWYVFHSPPLPFVPPFSRLLNKFGLLKPPADLV